MVDTDINNKIEEQYEFSVTEISAKIHGLLEDYFNIVKIKGEISNFKISSSGHGYFDLKDSRAVISAVFWRNALKRVKFALSEGLEVVVTGRITAYSGQSKYQVSVFSINLSGYGSFLKILQERKEKLTKEGLFLTEHKKKIPFFPKRIGVITSLTGSVIKDIIHRVSNRCPVHLIIWPVSVQGKTAADEITNAINGFNRISSNIKPDLLIVARGGGSIEDLWSFNEEKVVRAVYNSDIALISAVGHETDYTLIDLVADLRAPTPTAAAEFSVPVLGDIKNKLNALFNNCDLRTKETLLFKSKTIKNYCRIYYFPIRLITHNIQHIDDVGFRLLQSIENFIEKIQKSLKYFSYTRFNPVRQVDYQIHKLENVFNNLVNNKKLLFSQLEHKLDTNVVLLSSLDYKNVLRRGYAMVQDLNGKYISSLVNSRYKKYLRVKFYDGNIVVNTKEIKLTKE